MPVTTEPEQKLIIGLAQSQVCPDPDVAECWEVFIQGLTFNYFGAGQLERIAYVVESGSGIGAEEISIDAEGDDVVVTFVRNECRCSRALFVAALRELHRRYLVELERARAEQARRGDQMLHRRVWRWVRDAVKKCGARTRD